MKIVLSSLKLEVKSNKMLKLIAVNYTVMLNGYSQWLNIKGEFFFFIETSVVLISVMLAFNHKKDAIEEILNIYCLCCL